MAYSSILIDWELPKGLSRSTYLDILDIIAFQVIFFSIQVIINLSERD